jgi:hypothetical protein
MEYHTISEEPISYKKHKINLTYYLELHSDMLCTIETTFYQVQLLMFYNVQKHILTFVGNYIRHTINNHNIVVIPIPTGCMLTSSIFA